MCSSLLSVLWLAFALCKAQASPSKHHAARWEFDSSSSSLANAPYKDAWRDVDSRVSDLLSWMTLNEKTAQLMQGDVTNWLNITDGSINSTGLEANFEQKAGMFYVGYPITWTQLADGIRLGQDWAVNHTRLSIPAIVQTEGIHGFLIGNATLFNSPIGQACSWNRSLITDMATQIAREARTLGVTQLFAPLADLARELRYGRVEETYGEDGYLAGELAMSYVMATQALNVSSMVKHYAAYSLPEQGLNTAPVAMGERELRTIWLPSYRKAIMDGGAWSIMSAYSSLDGVPQVSDPHTLTEILREEWGYAHWVSSDAGGTDRLANSFFTCPQPLGTYGGNLTDGNKCVTLQALCAGGDVEMGGGSFNYRSIPELVSDGQLQESFVDTAVSRLLKAKFEMGLFEDPLPTAAQSEWPEIINNEYAKQLARELDRDSIVLLKNDAKTLPLSKGAKIAVIGPMADYNNYGDYVVYQSQNRGVTPLQGIRAAAKNVTFAQGCERWSLDQSAFPQAVQAARDADVAVVIVGTWSRDQNQLWQGFNATTGEHVDEDNLDLVGAMRPLAQAIVNTSTPTVIVFSSGKPLTETWIDNTTASLVQQFYPSQEGGYALADILFGDVNPSGKLSVSFPRSVGDLPVYYDYLRSGRPVDPGLIGADEQIYFGHQYVIGSPTPWYAFGHGLSYTSFDYGEIGLSSAYLNAWDTVLVSVNVTNNGTRDGAEVVQLYVRDEIASVDVPNKRLCGFEKVWIPAGETRTVTIDLCVKNLGLWNRNMQYQVETGEFTAWVGAASDDLRSNSTFWVQ